MHSGYNELWSLNYFTLLKFRVIALNIIKLEGGEVFAKAKARAKAKAKAKASGPYKGWVTLAAAP